MKLKLMQIAFDVAEDIARQLAVNPADLPRAALEALAIEGARAGKLTTEQVRRMLGFATRYETDGFLKQHEVFFRLSAADFTKDAATASEFSQCSSSPIPPLSTT